MDTNGRSESRLRLCWLRYAEQGRLACDLGVEVTPDSFSSKVSSCAGTGASAALGRLAERLFRAAPAERATEVHLPFIPRGEWKLREVILDSCGEFALYGSRLLPASLAESPRLLDQYQTLLLAASAFRCDQAATLEVCEPDLKATLDTRSCAAWRNAPPESRAAYFAAHAPATLAVQQRLREVLPLRWIQHPVHRTHFEDTCHILAWASSFPHHGRPRTEFTWNYMKPRWERSAFHFSLKPLTAWLEALCSRLNRDGEVELAKQYRRIVPTEFISRIRTGGCPELRTIAMCEERVVNNLLEFGAGIREAPDVGRAAALARRFAEQFPERLRRMACGLDIPGLASVVLMDATRALHRRQTRA